MCRGFIFRVEGSQRQNSKNSYGNCAPFCLSGVPKGIKKRYLEIGRGCGMDCGGANGERVKSGKVLFC
jgi:hypothetical protein